MSPEKFPDGFALMKSLVIAIPAYRNASLLRQAVVSVLDNLAEIADRMVNVVLINDSPDDPDVGAFCDEARNNPAVTVLTNETNLGFVKTANKGLLLARQQGADCILVNADTITFPGTLKELLAATQVSEQIGFACPRSNNAALATFPLAPHPQSGITATPERCHTAWQMLKDRLPQYSITPTAVGFYLYISKRVLRTVPLLDEAFGKGYEEENDFILRANKLGFISIVANHSYAYHYGSASFRLIEGDVDERKAKNLAVMAGRHPEFIPLVRHFERSPERRAEELLRFLLPDYDGKLRIVFDVRRMGQSFNGTSILARRMLSALCAASQQHFQIYAYCDKNVYDFHELSKIDGLNHATSLSTAYGISISIGQPFDLHDINVLQDLAPINVYNMLDVIAHDCGYLRAQNSFKLDLLWQHVADHSDGVAFISEFSATEFRSRFGSRESGPALFSKLLPTNPRAWMRGQPAPDAPSAGSRHVLVLGNHFHHKYSEETGKRLAERFPNLEVVSFGSTDSRLGNLRMLRAGDLPDATIYSLFADASVIIFPSFYEGFGIGLLEAFAHAKPIVARDTPTAREIAGSFDSIGGLYFYETSGELFSQLEAAIGETSWTKGGEDWSDWADSFLGFLQSLAARADTGARLVRRLRATMHLNEHFQLAQLLAQKQEDSATKADLPHFTESPKADSLADCLHAPSDEEFLLRAFAIVLGRKADPSGLRHYAEMLAQGGDRAQVIANLLFSKEMATHAGNFDSYVLKRRSRGFFDLRRH